MDPTGPCTLSLSHLLAHFSPAALLGRPRAEAWGLSSEAGRGPLGLGHVSPQNSGPLPFAPLVPFIALLRRQIKLGLECEKPVQLPRLGSHNGPRAVRERAGPAAWRGQS